MACEDMNMHMLYFRSRNVRKKS